MKWQLRQLPLIRRLIYPRDRAKCFIFTASVSVHTNLWSECKDSAGFRSTGRDAPSTHMHTHTLTYIVKHTLTHTLTQMHTHSYTHAHIHTHPHTHMHTHTHTNTHTHSYTHTNTYTHTPAHTPCKVRHRDSCLPQGPGWIPGAQPCSASAS